MISEGVLDETICGAISSDVIHTRIRKIALL